MQEKIKELALAYGLAIDEPEVMEAVDAFAAEIAKLFERKVIWEGIWDSAEDGEVIELYNLVKDGQRARVVVEEIE